MKFYALMQKKNAEVLSDIWTVCCMTNSYPTHAIWNTVSSRGTTLS